MDILEQKQYRNRGEVPQDYFSELQNRLMAIPEADASREEAVGRWPRFSPYLALAASFALLFAVGSLVFDRPDEDDIVSYEDMVLADMVPLTDPFSESYEPFEHADELTGDEIIDYLMETRYNPDRD